MRTPSPSVALLLDVGSDPTPLSALGVKLAEALPERWQVFTCGYQEPRDLVEVLERILAQGCRELVVVPTQPQFSTRGTGRVMRTLYRVLAEQGDALDLAVHATWHDDAGYVSALARRVADFASTRGVGPSTADLVLVGPRHTAGARSDPYAGEAARTAELVAERVGWPPDRVRVGAWDEVEPGEAALVCPLGPTVSIPASEGGRFPSLAVFPPFVAALKRIVLKGPRPVPRGRKAPAPLLPAPSPGRATGEPATLVSLCASVEGGLGPGPGPDLSFSSSRAFAQVKRSHAWLQGFLDWARESTPLREAFVWNTCQRVEFYGWLPGADDGAVDPRLVARIRRKLFGTEPEGLEVNVLAGPAARHHLLRTACGLNSDLPGDRDVVAQLQTACRRAQGAGTAGALSSALVAEAVALTEEVGSTDFGRFATGYCAAALTRIREKGRRDLDQLRHVVIGGSTTSRSVLCALRSEHGVPEDQLTSVYRDHHGQMKQLRAAVGNGRRLRVHTYSEDRVLRAVADADMVYFGIDQSEPVLEAATLDELRDYAARPLTVVDFNSFGSLAAPPTNPDISLWTAHELDYEVAIHAAVTTTRDGFIDAVQEAEEWIERHLAAWAPRTGQKGLAGLPTGV